MAQLPAGRRHGSSGVRLGGRRRRRKVLTGRADVEAFKKMVGRRAQREDENLMRMVERWKEEDAKESVGSTKPTVQQTTPVRRQRPLREEPEVAEAQDDEDEDEKNRHSASESSSSSGGGGGGDDGGDVAEKGMAACASDEEQRQIQPLRQNAPWKNDMYGTPEMRRARQSAFFGDPKDLAAEFARALDATQERAKRNFIDPADLNGIMESIYQKLGEKFEADARVVQQLLQRDTKSAERLQRFLQEFSRQKSSSERWIVSYIGGVNVRKAPSRTADIVGALDPGEEVVEDEREGAWIFSKHNGWICTEANNEPLLRRIDGNLTIYVVTFDLGVNTREDPNVLSNTTGPGLDTGFAFPALEEKDGWVRSSDGWVAMSNETTKEPFLESIKLADLRRWRVSFGPGLNVRAYPTKNSPIMNTLDFGQTFLELGRTGDWIKSAFGWVLVEEMGQSFLEPVEAEVSFGVGLRQGDPKDSTASLHLSELIDGQTSQKSTVEFLNEDGEIEAYVLECKKQRYAVSKAPENVRDSWKLKHYVNARFRSEVNALRFLSRNKVLEDERTWSGSIPSNRIREVLQGLLELTRKANISFSIAPESTWWLTRPGESADVARRRFTEVASDTFGFDPLTAPLRADARSISDDDEDSLEAIRRANDPNILAMTAAKIEAERMAKMASDAAKVGSVDQLLTGRPAPLTPETIERIKAKDPEAIRSLGGKWDGLAELRKQIEEEEKEDPSAGMEKGIYEDDLRTLIEADRRKQEDRGLQS